MMGSAALLCVLSLLEAADGSYVMTDSTIRTAVQTWLYNPSYAEAAYGHISTWDTSGVTYMSSLFYEASAFNEDISAWDTSGVTAMDWMFQEAMSFNQDLSGWSIDSVTTMYQMFASALAFDQDLGWCVDDGVGHYYAFHNTQCESTSCGVHSRCYMTDSTIKTAVAAWLSDSAAAEATYGHISTWETGGVTDMSRLFENELSFNEDIGAWDTSGVTTTYRMFHGASAFNRDIGGWAVDSVTDMSWMFNGGSFNQDISAWVVHSATSMQQMFDHAYAFDQDLGWCVGDDVNLHWAFTYTQCEATSCGVVRCSTKGKEQTPVAIIAGAAAAAALLLAAGAFCFYRRRKASMADKADEPSGANPEPTELSAPVVAISIKEQLATILIAPEAEEAATEQPPPPPPRRWFSRAEHEAAALKAEEMYKQIATWYNQPENAALRATWGAYPEPEDFQTWPGIVTVTNAFLDREAVWGRVVP